LLAGKFYGTEITNYVISELNKKLVGKVAIEEVSFSLLRKFPDASIIFKGVTASAPDDFQAISANEKNLLAADIVFLQLNIMDLIDGVYNINEIHIEDAILNIASDKNGKFNYNIFKTDNNTSDNSTIKLNLDEVVLKNTYFTYFNHKDDFYSQGKIDKAVLTGEYQNKNLSSSIKTSLFVDELRIKENTFIKRQKLELETNIAFANNVLTLHNAKGYYSSIGYKINGDINTENQNISLTAELDDAYIEDMLNSINIKKIDTLKNYNIKGMARIHAVLIGNKSAYKLLCNVTTSPTSFIFDKKKYTVKAKGRFEAKDLNNIATYSFISDDFNLSYNNSTVSGKVNVTNFNTLNIDTKLQAKIALPDINSYIKDIGMKGLVAGTINFKSELKDVKKIDEKFIDKSNLSCDVTISNGAISAKKFQASNINGNVKYNSKNCKLKKLQVTYKGSSCTVNGELKNLLEFALLKNNQLGGNIVLHSPAINLNSFKNANITSSGRTKGNKWELPGDMHLNIYITTPEFVYDKIVLKNVKANIVYRKPAIHVTSLYADALDGKISGNIKLVQYRNLNCVLKGATFLEAIDVKKLFTTFNNFDQEFLQSRHLKGKLTADASFFTEWTNDFEIFKNTLFIESTTTVTDGHLVNFEPLQKLSKKEEIEELKQVTFSELSNTIIIKDEQIIIPRMKIESSAFNIELAGTQDFNGKFEYQFQVILDEILSKKRKKVKRKNEIGEIEEDGLGRIKIFLVIKDDPEEEYKIYYDKKRGKEVFQEKVKNEKKVIGDALRKEFKFLRKDTVRNSNTEPDGVKEERKWFKKGPSTEIKGDNEIEEDITPVFDDF